MQLGGREEAATSSQSQPDGKRSLPKGAHVRFSHVEVDGGAAQDTGNCFYLGNIDILKYHTCGVLINV
jgi:hypothetical protein